MNTGTQQTMSNQVSPASAFLATGASGSALYFAAASSLCWEGEAGPSRSSVQHSLKPLSWLARLKPHRWVQACSQLLAGNFCLPSEFCTEAFPCHTGPQPRLCICQGSGLQHRGGHASSGIPPPGQGNAAAAAGQHAGGGRQRCCSCAQGSSCQSSSAADCVSGIR